MRAMRQLYKKHIDCINAAIECGHLGRRQSGQDFKLNETIFRTQIVMFLISVEAFLVKETNENGYPLIIEPNLESDIIKNVHLLNKNIIFKFGKKTSEDERDPCARVIGFGIKDNILHVKCYVGFNRFVPVSSIVKTFTPQAWDL